jgi:hypothetical protein
MIDGTYADYSTLGRMPYRLTVASDLVHDGDHFTRYQLTAETADFFGRAVLWAYDYQHRKLAEVLHDFPSSVPASVEFAFSSCGLRFETADGCGHCSVWATLRAEDPWGTSERFEQASICIGFEPAALDSFCADLKRFEWGCANEAILEGRAP